MKRAVIYARLSDDRDDPDAKSVESQIAACRERAAELGAAVVGVYRDDGFSGRTAARPGFRTAINRACGDDEVDYFICWSSARFGRNRVDCVVYKNELESAGVRLVYASSSIDRGTDEGWMFDSIQELFDESYSRTISRDTKRSMMKGASDGFFMGGRVPFGYEAVKVEGTTRRKLVPHPTEAATLRMIFQWAAEGTGAYLIALKLNEQGIAMRHGARWRKGSVLHMLKSEVYMGDVIYNRFNRVTRKPRPESDWVRVKAHEPLVSAEVFSAVQQGLGARAPREDKQASNSHHIFTGLLRCGLCNNSLQIATGTGRGGKVYSYYACRGDLQGCSCQFKRFRAEPFERWLLDQLLDKLMTRETIQAVLDRLDEAAASWIKDRAARRMGLVLEKRTAESRRSNILGAIEAAGGNTQGLGEMLSRLQELGDQIAALERQIVALENEPEPPVGRLEVSAEEAAAVFRETITGCDDPKKLRGYVATIAQMIVVHSTEVVVHYKPECLIQEDGAPVHSKHNWLPVLSKLRTAQFSINRLDSLGKVTAELRRAA